MIVRAAHPVPFRYLAANARQPRLAFVRAETEAEIPELPRTAFEPLPRTLDGKVCHRRGDELWVSMRARSAGMDHFDAADFAAWLRGEPIGAEAASAAFGRMMRTPLVAMRDGGPGYPDKYHDSVREGGRTPRHRVLLHDAGREASAALAAFLRDEVAIVDGGVRVRARPLAVFDTLPGTPVARLALFHGRGWCRPEADIVADPARIGAVGARLRRFDPPRNAPDLDAFLEMMPGRPAGGDDARWCVHALARPVAQGLRLCAGDDPGLADLVEQAARIGDLSTIGAVPDAGVPAALDVLGRAAAVMEERHDAGIGWRTMPMLDAARNLTRILGAVRPQPGLAATDAEAAEDAEAIAGIAP